MVDSLQAFLAKSSALLFPRMPTYLEIYPASTILVAIPGSRVVVDQLSLSARNSPMNLGLNYVRCPVCRRSAASSLSGQVVTLKVYFAIKCAILALRPLFAPITSALYTPVVHPGGVFPCEIYSL